jgi:peptidoglycan/LPS O-acetylase OafA/YrhL
MSTTRENAPVRISGLDGLRAISILLVLMSHGWATIPSVGQWGWLEPYVGNASLGVTTFFVISGYLITHLLRNEWQQTGTISLRSFYIRRILRIWPAFYTYLIVVALLRSQGWIHTDYGDIGFAGAFLTNYEHLFRSATNDSYWFVGHFWTLSLEEQFYLLWPAAIVLVGLPRAPRIAGAIILAAPVLRVVSYFLWPDSRAQLSMMLHTAADPIMIGCLAALWQGQPSFESFLRRFAAWWWPLVASLAVLVGSAWFTGHFHGAYKLTLGVTFNSCAIVFLMLWVVRHPQSRLGSFLSTPVMRGLGVLSYSLYLWQQLFLTPMNHTLSGSFPLNLLACLAAAAASYCLIERPFLSLRRRFRPPAVMQAAR